MASLVLKPKIPNLDLIPNLISFSLSPKNVIFLFLFWLHRVLVGAHGIFHCSMRALGLNCPAACGILVPWPGTEPTSRALEGGFLTSGLPGKFPQKRNLNQPVWNFLVINNEVMSHRFLPDRKGNLHGKTFAFPSPPKDLGPKQTINQSFFLLSVSLSLSWLTTSLPHPLFSKSIPFYTTP